MGLLDKMPAQQAAAPKMGGLLGSMATPQQAAPQQTQGGSPQAMQMAQMLAQSPTPETVQMVVGELMKKGTPESKQMADILTQVQSSPESVTKVAQAIMQQIQGGQ